MKKRFTDIELYDRAWFRRLPPRLKCAWDWLTRRCDIIGVWNIDMDRMSFEVGETVTLEELKEHFKIQVIDGDKVFIPGFVAFQYGDESGKLSRRNRLHLSVAEKLAAQGLPLPDFKTEEAPRKDSFLKGLPSDSQVTPNPLGSGQGQGQGQGHSSSSVSVDQIARCVEVWRGTLARFKIEKDPGLDAPAIGQLIQRHGIEKTTLALLGAGNDNKSKDHDPAQHVSVTRLLMRPHVFEKLVNLGAQNKPRELKVFDGGGP